MAAPKADFIRAAADFDKMIAAYSDAKASDSKNGRGLQRCFETLRKELTAAAKAHPEVCAAAASVTLSPCSEVLRDWYQNWPGARLIPSQGPLQECRAVQTHCPNAPNVAFGQIHLPFGRQLDIVRPGRARLDSAWTSAVCFADMHTRHAPAAYCTQRYINAQS